MEVQVSCDVVYTTIKGAPGIVLLVVALQFAWGHFDLCPKEARHVLACQNIEQERRGKVLHAKIRIENHTCLES